MVAGCRAPIESTLVVAETEFEPTTKFSLPRRMRKCVSKGKGKAKSAGGRNSTLAPSLEFRLELVA